MDAVASPGKGKATPPAVKLTDARLSLGAAKLEDLFPEDDAYRRSLISFTVLLILAAFIASFGLYQDSVAAIIGAMVVAPLGGAMIALAGALVTARSRWQVLSFVQVIAGAAGVIAIGYLVSMLLPDILALTPSLKARTTPGVLDLGVALAAGAAGGWVAIRRTGSDALPGVAIAVSLVPPLATVGICLELGRPDDAAGALLLFVTNFAAIVVAACVVFALLGAAPSKELRAERHRVRNGFLLATFALVIIAIPLVVHGVSTVRSLILSSTGAPAVAEWVGSRDLEVREWSITGDTVSLVLAGSDPPGDTGELAASLATVFGTPVTVDIQYVPTLHSRASANP